MCSSWQFWHTEGWRDYWNSKCQKLKECHLRYPRNRTTEERVRSNYSFYNSSDCIQGHFRRGLESSRYLSLCFPSSTLNKWSHLLRPIRVSLPETLICFLNLHWPPPGPLFHFDSLESIVRCKDSNLTSSGRPFPREEPWNMFRSTQGVCDGVFGTCSGLYLSSAENSQRTLTLEFLPWKILAGERGSKGLRSFVTWSQHIKEMWEWKYWFRFLFY